MAHATGSKRSLDNSQKADFRSGITDLSSLLLPDGRHSGRDIEAIQKAQYETATSEPGKVLALEFLFRNGRIGYSVFHFFGACLPEYLNREVIMENRLFSREIN